MTGQSTMLPLVIEAEGKIITSNFPAFAEAVRARLADFNLDLRTDEEFDQAALDAKLLKGCEDELSAAKERALAQAEDLNSLFEQIDGLKGELATARLKLSKQIDDQKAKIKREIIESALAMLECDKSMREVFRPNLELATKGKKNFQTMREAVRIALTVTNDQIARAKRLLDEFVAEHGQAILPDRRNLEATDPVALAAELRRRVEAASAQAEAKRLREIADKAAQEAATARRETELAQAKQDLARLSSEPLGTWVESPSIDDAPWLPEPEASGPGSSVPAIDPDMTIAESEWVYFSDAVKSAFAMLRMPREMLETESNKARAAKFAIAVNAAWKEANA